MSDAAFKQAAYPAYTKAQLIIMLAGKPYSLSNPRGLTGDQRRKMEAEVLRRDAVEAGDLSVMTPGERLRYARSQEA